MFLFQLIVILFTFFFLPKIMAQVSCLSSVLPELKHISGEEKRQTDIPKNRKKKMIFTEELGKSSNLPNLIHVLYHI